MTEHKRQHYIPSSYLKAWCDPNTPSGQTPYVWRFSKDGNQNNKEVPQKIFYETDMYTIYTQDGERDLTLEYNLSRVEGEFSKLRVRKLNLKQSLTPREHFMLCMFVAAMTARTKAFGEYQSSQWQRALDLGEKVQSAFENASTEERKQMSAALASPYADKEESMSMDDVRELVEHPIQSMLTPNVVQIAPLLYKKQYLIIETTDSVGFITSDNPCVWFDPANYQDPRPFGAGGLISPTLEITLPLSPNQMLLFGGKLIISGAYIPENDIKMVENLNKRTRLFADKYFISNCPTFSPAWF